MEREHDLLERLLVLDWQRAPREAVHGYDLEVTVELNQADVAAFEKVERAACRCTCIHDGTPKLRSVIRAPTRRRRTAQRGRAGLACLELLRLGNPGGAVSFWRNFRVARHQFAATQAGGAGARYKLRAPGAILVPVRLVLVLQRGPQCGVRRCKRSVRQGQQRYRDDRGAADLDEVAPGRGDLIFHGDSFLNGARARPCRAQLRLNSGLACVARGPAEAPEDNPCTNSHARRAHGPGWRLGADALVEGLAMTHCRAAVTKIYAVGHERVQRIRIHFWTGPRPSCNSNLRSLDHERSDQ